MSQGMGGGMYNTLGGWDKMVMGDDGGVMSVLHKDVETVLGL